jgi:hypothetical protein
MTPTTRPTLDYETEPTTRAGLSLVSTYTILTPFVVAIETEAREALAAELAARDAALGEMDDAAEEYINAVVAYLDPENQYTESRLDAMRIAVSDLIVAIQRRRLDVIATPFAAREGPPDGA